MKNLNGIKEIEIKHSFTKKSAVASDTQSGAIPNNPSKGSCSAAQVTSLKGSKKLKKLEKAIKKKIIVSKKDPITEEISGAFHHFSFLRELKIDISKN